jgi:SulP family sulfate permease
MTNLIVTSGGVRRWFPFLDWVSDLDNSTIRPDLEAGFIGAVLILPQAIALATLAGMPPEYGIYASIFPVIIASLWGSSWHTLSGPNTAVCVLIAFSVAPFASIGNEIYIGYVLALTLMVGVIQFVIGVAKLGAVLDFISHTVVSAIVLAVSFIIILSAASSFLGLLSNAYEPFLIRLYQVFNDVPRANGYAVMVGATTVVSGLITRYYWKRYSLVVAVVLGTLMSVCLNLLFGSATTELEHVGYLSLSLLPLSMPSFDLESMYVLKELTSSAFAIAFLGLMQTVVISRSIASKSGQHIDTNQEIVSQGLSNMIAPFFSSFAGSGSFNRSAAHYEAGAKTPMAAVYASVILAVLVLLSSNLIAYIPSAAVAGALILVGYGLIDVKDVKQVLQSRQEAIIFSLTFVSSLLFGLNSGVFTGLLLSLILYLWYASTPNVVLEEYTARDGRPVSVVIIDGNLFFGSVRHVERCLNGIGDPSDSSIILIRTDHLTYLDVPGAVMIGAEVKRRRDKGDDVYIYVTRKDIVNILNKSGCLDIIGEDHLIYKEFDHEMKSLLYPPQTSDFINTERVNVAAKRRNEDEPMKALAKRLRNTRLLGPLTTAQLTTLLEEAEVKTAKPGEIVINQDESMQGHLILTEGSLEAQRTWSADGRNDKSYTWELKPTEIEGGFAFLSESNRIRVRAITDIKYVLIDADKIDALIGWDEHFADDIVSDPELKRRMDLIKQVSVFYKVPLENIKEVFKRMQTREVEAGETVIEQGEKGDCYYVIESGRCDVIQTDPFTDETTCIDTMGPGDAFGEEALIQDSYRNATITMTTPGTLLTLDKKDFDSLLRSELVEEIAPKDAVELVKKEKFQWLDCRYDMEYEESRIPGAPLIPLGELRKGAQQLDPDVTYIVYCRSGRRSKAAAYLLKEMDIEAISLQGGIKDWPYEVDAEVL